MSALIGTIQVRKGTSVQWATANPVLLQGEPGLDTDSGIIKYGDGVTAWGALTNYEQYTSGEKSKLSGIEPGATANDDTDSLIEGVTNLYYTQTRFNSAFSGKSTSDLIEGINLYYTQARFDSAFSAKSTSGLTEGSNLYYTNDRADARITAQKGAALGLAPLDSGGKISSTYLPDSVLGNLKYKGTYNGVIVTSEDVTLNGNALPTAGSANVGYYFIATTAFTLNAVDYAVGDWVLSNGATGYTKVDNSDSVTTVFGRLGNIVANAGDYNTSQVTENASYLYYTDTRARAAITGTTNRITSTGGVIDISTSYVGQSSITTLGTIATGVWNGTAIADTYISSAAIWNAKQNALTFSTGLAGTTTITNTLATGLAGGQSIYGGTAANESLTLVGTTHGTKTTSKIILGTTEFVTIGGATANKELSLKTVANNLACYIGEYNSTQAALWLHATTPTTSNYAITVRDTGSSQFTTYVNGVTGLNLTINNSNMVTLTGSLFRVLSAASTFQVSSASTVIDGTLTVSGNVTFSGHTSGRMLFTTTGGLVTSNSKILSDGDTISVKPASATGTAITAWGNYTSTTVSGITASDIGLEVGNSSNGFNNFSAIKFNNTGSGNSYGIFGIQAMNVGGFVSPDFVWASKYNGGTTTETMRLTNAGLLGIGGTSATSKLYVTTSTTGAYTIEAYTTAGNGSCAYFDSTGTSGGNSAIKAFSNLYSYYSVSRGVTSTAIRDVHYYGTSSGNYAAGTGFGALYELQNASGTYRNMVRTSVSWTNATNGTEQSAFKISTMVAGAALAVNLSLDGADLTVVGFINAASYKVGGTAGVMGTWTTVDGKTITATNGIITSIV